MYISRLRAGERLTDVVRAGPSSRARSDINAALAGLTVARRGSRAATFRQLVGEGMTGKEIAANWGFSQQVVSRIVTHGSEAG